MLNALFTAASQVNWDRTLRRVAIFTVSTTGGYAFGSIIGKALQRSTPSTATLPSSGHH